MTALRGTVLRSFAFAAVCGFFAVVFSFGNISALASKGNLRAVHAKVSAPMNITLGKADIVNLPAGVSDVLVADPSVADVQAVQANRLYIVGLAIGDTNIIVLDAKGNVVKRMDIHVSYDLKAIQSLINTLFPNEDVTVGSIHDQIILTGTASKMTRMSLPLRLCLVQRLLVKRLEEVLMVLVLPVVRVWQRLKTQLVF